MTSNTPRRTIAPRPRGRKVCGPARREVQPRGASPRDEDGAGAPLAKALAVGEQIVFADGLVDADRPSSPLADLGPLGDERRHIEAARRHLGATAQDSFLTRT